MSIINYLTETLSLRDVLMTVTLCLWVLERA